MVFSKKALNDQQKTPCYFPKHEARPQNLVKARCSKLVQRQKLHTHDLSMRLTRGCQVLTYANIYLHASFTLSNHLPLNFENLVLATNWQLCLIQLVKRKKKQREREREKGIQPSFLWLIKCQNQSEFFHPGVSLSFVPDCFA